MKLNQIKNIVLNILVWIFLAWAIYWLLLKLTGHSPTADQINLALTSGIFIYIVKIHKDVAVLKQRFKEADRRFFALARDFKKYLETND